MSITLGQSSKGRRLDLSLDYAIESSAIIARKGLGKTHTAKCIVEDLHAGHVQTVVIDPLDVWWGLRLAADGKGKGCDVIIFGGEHADLPLTETMGVVLADLVVDREVSVVLVLDHLSKSAMRRFTADFCEHLYARKTKHRTPLHIVIDECDIFIPQKPPPEAFRCLGVVDSMVRHGRSRGLGSTVISQRPAIINKDVLTQTECLITLGLTSPQDRKAVLEWIEAQASVEQAKEFLTSLAGMERGDAWIWSPSRFKVFERIKVRAARTYDSSYTPTVGAKRRETPKLSPVDLERIKGEMESVLAEQRENDPKVLKARIKELEKQISSAGRAPNKAELREHIEEALHDIKKVLASVTRERDQKDEIITGIRTLIRGESPKALTKVEREWVSEAARPFILGPGSNPPRPDASAIKAKAAELTEGLDGEMTGPERKILTVLAQHGEHHPGDAVHHSTLAIRAGYSYSGGFRNYLSALKGKGWIGKRDGVGFFITSEGLQALGDYESMPTGSDLLIWWRQRVTGPEVKILNHLAAVPTGLGGPALAANCGYEFSGGFRNYLSSLRTKGLIVGRGRDLITLHPDLTD